MTEFELQMTKFRRDAMLRQGFTEDEIAQHETLRALKRTSSQDDIPDFAKELLRKSMQ